YAEGRYIPPLALVFRALTPVLGVLTPVVDDPSSGAMPIQNCPDWAMQHSDCRVADPGLPASAPKLCCPGTPRKAGPVITSAPVLTGGMPSGCGVLSAPELVIGGSEL